MLSRRGSDASTNLRRTKSTSCVPRKPVRKLSTLEVRPEAREHAVFAAHKAFDNAKALAQAQQHVQELQRAQSNRQIRKTRRSGEGRLSGEGSHLSRRNSLYLAPPEPQAHKYPILQKSTPQLQRAASVNQKRPAPSPASDVPSVTSTEQHFAERFDGYRIPPNAQVRKTIVRRATTIAETSQPEHASSITPAQGRPRGLTVTVPLSRGKQTDEDIKAMARDKYLREQMQPLKRRSSFLMPFRSITRKAKKEPMLMDETLSDKQSIDVPQPEVSHLEHVPPNPVRPPPPPPKPSSNTDTPRTRSLSSTFGSLKRGWRRTFGRSSSDQQRELAIQNIVTQALYRSHQENHEETDAASSHRTSSELFPSLSMGTPPPPPPHLVDVRRSFSTTRDASLIAERDHDVTLRSRVSSWNDSTRHSTILDQDQTALSVIPESPEKRYIADIEVPALDTSKTGHQFAALGRSDSTGYARNSVDGRRLVSALMRHRRESSEREGAKRKSSFSSLLRKSGDTVRSQQNPLPQQQHNDYVMSASIRNVSEELPFGYPEDYSHGNISSTPTRQERVQLMSPSVYSERSRVAEQGTTPDSSSTRLPDTPPGVATVLQSEAVSKWSLEKNKKSHRRSTSNEWRMWAAEEFSGLEGRASFSIPEFSRPTYDPEGRVVSASRSSMENAPLNAMSADSTLGTRQASSSLKSQHMSITLPTIESDASSGASVKVAGITIPKRKSSLSAVQPALSGNSRRASFFGREDEAPSQRRVVQEPSNQDLLSKPGETGNQATKARHPLAGVKSQEASIHGGSNEPSPQSESESPLRRRRRPGLDENFLLRIRRGPYGVSTGSLSKGSNSSMDSVSLPKHRATAVGAVGKENTPPSRGQKMASEFLNSRSSATSRADSNTPAFV